MIKLIYDTKTGHSKSICENVSKECFDIKNIESLDENDHVILFTHTEGKGITPENSLKFMEKFHDKVIGYVVSGNYIKHPFELGWAGLDLHKKYSKPIIRLVQQEGTKEDFEYIKAYIENLKNFNIE